MENPNESLGQPDTYIPLQICQNLLHTMEEFPKLNMWLLSFEICLKKYYLCKKYWKIILKFPISQKGRYQISDFKWQAQNCRFILFWLSRIILFWKLSLHLFTCVTLFQQFVADQIWVNSNLCSDNWSDQE